MELDVETFLKSYPKFDCFEEGEIETAIEFSKCFINECAFGEKTTLALKLITAHQLTVNDQQAGGGIIVSDKVGDLSRTWKTPNDITDMDAYFTQSRFGISYLALRGTILRTPRVLG